MSRTLSRVVSRIPGPTPSTGGTTILDVATWADRDTGLDDGTLIRVADGPLLALAKTYHYEITATWAATTTWRLNVKGVNYDVVSPASLQALVEAFVTALNGVGTLEADDDNVYLYIWDTTSTFSVTPSIVSGAGTWGTGTAVTAAEYVPVEIYDLGLVWESICPVHRELATSAVAREWTKYTTGAGTVTWSTDHHEIRSAASQTSYIVRQISTTTKDRLLLVDCVGQAGSTATNVSMCFTAEISGSGMAKVHVGTTAYKLRGQSGDREIDITSRTTVLIGNLNKLSSIGGVFAMGNGVRSSALWVTTANNRHLIGDTASGGDFNVDIYRAYSGRVG